MSNFANELEEELVSQASFIGKTLRAIKDLPEIGRLISSTPPGYLRVSTLMASTTLQSYRKALGSKWIQKDRVTQDMSGNKYYRFVHKKTDIPLTLCRNVKEKT